MFTDDHLRREITDILNRKLNANRKDIVDALYDQPGRASVLCCAV